MSTSGDKSYSVKRKCRFSDHMKSKYPCFDDGRSEHEARCLVCESYLSVANKGITDLERHVNSEKHRSRVAAFYEPQQSPESTKVRATESLALLGPVVLSLVIGLVGPMRKMCNDSETAKNIAEKPTFC